jgi:hypothetical protein
MDSDPDARDESQHKQQPGETVALNYIDKVHASLTRQWDAMSRALTGQIIISLITVAVCIGAVTPQEKFSLLGLGLTASINTVLTGSTFLIAAFHVMTLGSLLRAMRTADTLRRLYENAGYQDESMGTSIEDPFGGAAPIYTLLILWASDPTWSESRLRTAYMASLLITIYGGLALVLPVAAELAALVKVASLMGWGGTYYGQY